MVAGVAGVAGVAVLCVPLISSGVTAMNIFFLLMSSSSIFI